MGYYSDIRILIEESEFYRLSSKLQEYYESVKDKAIYDLIQNLVIKQVRTGITLDESKEEIRYIYFGWNDLKWYGRFRDVEIVEDFLLELDEYHYIRMGETPTDIYEVHNLEKTNVKCIEFARYFTGESEGG